MKSAKQKQFETLDNILKILEKYHAVGHIGLEAIKDELKDKIQDEELVANLGFLKSLDYISMYDVTKGVKIKGVEPELTYKITGSGLHFIRTASFESGERKQRNSKVFNYVRDITTLILLCVAAYLQYTSNKQQKAIDDLTIQANEDKKEIRALQKNLDSVKAIKQNVVIKSPTIKINDTTNIPK